ncbi:glycoside hydrolase family 16 protein [Candidatus Saccharibacteria bacterium]|nr:glycoside hydrolase family 16 protein [Candidatus Saccharibacteria bacterium]
MLADNKGNDPVLNKKIKFKLLKNKASFSAKQLLVFTVIFAVIGGFTIFRSLASGFVATLEPENATLSGAAVVGVDTNASGGKYVQFGSTTTPPPPPPPTSGTACTTAPPAGYTTVAFCDDFTGAANTAPDTTKWSIYGGTSPSRWGVECFVNSRKNIYLDGNGNIVMAGYKETSVPCTNGSGLYSSGGMKAATYKYKYGRAEARIKIPCGSGTWPAWWGTGSETGYPWPAGGEIDYLEAYGNDPTDAGQTLHGATTTGGHWQLNTDTRTSTWCNDYHTYGAKWSLGKIEWLVDGNIVGTRTPASMQADGVWPFDSHSESLILDLQLGSWGGAIDETKMPFNMITDWVRVYQ